MLRTSTQVENMDTGKIRDAQNYELSQLNKDYQKRKDKLVEQREGELAQLKKYYNDKEEGIRQHSEAAISHIKDRTQTQLEKEKEDGQKNIETTKKSLLSEKQVYDKNIRQVRQTQQDQLKKINTDFANQRQSTVEEYHSDIEKIQGTHDKTIKEAQTRNEKQLQKLHDENQKNIVESQNRGRNQLAKVSDTFREQIEKVHVDGNRKVDQQKVKLDSDLNTLKTENKKSLEKEHKSHAIQINNEQASFRKIYQDNKEKNKEEMSRQDKLLGSERENRQTAMEKSLRAQDRVFNRELLKQKLDWAEKLEPYESKKEDPFYKLIDRKSELEEKDGSYILRAYVPLYDKKSIQINVQPDKVSVQGQRTFKDESLDQGRKVSSQQFQSFREEFPFEHPIIEKAIIQERDGDFVTVTIPKLLPNSKKDISGSNLG